MQVNFSEKQNRQEYLIILLVIIVLAALFLLRKDIFKASTQILPAPEVFQPKSIEINFGVLKNPALKELQLPEPETPFEGKVGRENPFIPY